MYGWILENGYFTNTGHQSKDYAIQKLYIDPDGVRVSRGIFV